ncbi:MAG: PQQ-dependent dehydrogenase, methanol/ethanol family [Bryobacteraceae bacterium]|nr:PQQ-dependent dehydrogenase, methanol/ethanol family [Bryobacteraceae bacterium]
MKNSLPLALALWLCAPAAGQVPFERILKASSEPGAWLTYSGAYDGSRFSKLDEIRPGNVARLKARWVYQIRQDGEFECSPIVADGVMYVTEPQAAVSALDLATGRPLWRWARPVSDDVLTLGFPQTNRGVAVLDESVFVGTLDAKLVALDARSGIQRWETVVAENKLGYSLTLAPLAVKNKIIVGVSGAEAGIRGFLDAYDAKTGKRAWRFWTIPAPGEPGSDTWTGDAWKTGGGSTWVTGAYDPELNLVYWGTGNPGPDWNGDVRPGDNLFTCSLVALDADTGRLRWHFQFTPHDTHDWDATHVPVLLDGTIRGKQRKLVAVANRNAFYYVLDRATGEFLSGTPYAKQTWAKGLDDRGRPIVIPGTDPTPEGNLVWPSLNGSTVWFSPAYSPLTRLFYVATRERGSIYYKGEAIYRPGTQFMGGGERALPDDESWGAIRALEVETGRLKWEFPLHSPPWAGVLATAGGLVFSGSNEGNFFALDAATGKPLWDFQAGAQVRSNPISFLIDGRQHVAAGAGKTLFVFGLDGSGEYSGE